MFLYLTQTEEKTKFSKDPAIAAFVIACAYVAARAMTTGPNNGGSPLNPSIGVATNIVMSFKAGGDSLKWIWIYGLFPFAGAVLALVFHELVYKKTHDVIQEEEEHEALLDGK